MFRKFMTYAEAVGNDTTAINLRLIGGVMIAIGFFCIGVYALFMASQLIPKQRKRMTYLFGMFLCFCALARAFDVMGIWVNYARFDGLLMLITGVLSIVALIYLPFVAKAIVSIKTVHDATEKLQENIEKIEQVKEIGEQVIISNKRDDNPKPS